MKKQTIKLGYIGLGRRGMAMLKKCFSEMPDVEVSMICDLDQGKLDAAMRMLAEKNYPTVPKAVRDYHEILNTPEIDAVAVMTGWDMHIPCAIDSLKAGKYTAMEVGCAYDLSECYALLEAHESTKAPLMMLENCCYGRRELMTLRMVKEGLFGEIVHCEGAYHHHLNNCELFMKDKEGVLDTEHYRLLEYAKRNAEQYPTHELGPIAKVLGLNRGNRMLTLSSVASKARGIAAYMKKQGLEDHPMAGADFKQGDIVHTMITCAGGETIHLQLDTTLPRPYYSRHFTVRGTDGMCEEISKTVCTYRIHDVTESSVFNNEAEMFEKFDHPLHREYVALGERGDHGGIDWLVCRAFVESVKNGVNTPIDAYDTVSWLAIGPLSEMSIARGGAPVDVPDFTRGKWLRREPAVLGKYCLDEIVEDPDTPIFG